MFRCTWGDGGATNLNRTLHFGWRVAVKDCSRLGEWRCTATDVFSKVVPAGGCAIT